MSDFPPALVPLAGQRTWIGWRWGRPRGAKNTSAKLTKIPCDIGGHAIDSSDIREFRTYADLYDAIAHKVIDGAALASVGNVAGDRLVLDLDKCRNPETGTIAGWAQRILTACPTYAEVSPSGTGLRLIGAATGWDPDEKQRRWAVAGEPGGGDDEGRGEVFFRSGFATITFAALPGRAAAWGAIGTFASTLPVRKNDRKTSSSTVAVSGKPLQDIAIVRETLGFIPNGPDRESDWDWWCKIGMAVYRTTEGSPEGLEAWAAWSAQNPADGGVDTCAARWEHWETSSPPGRIGYGSLHRQAREAEKAAGRVWTGGPLWKASRLPPAGAGMGPVVAGKVPAGRAAPAGGGGGAAGPGMATADGIDVAGGAAVEHIGSASGAEAFGAEADLPVVQLGPVVHAIVDAADAAVAMSGLPVYQKSGKLVRPVMARAHTLGAGRETVSAAFRVIEPAEAVYLLSKAACWVGYDAKSEGWKRKAPPEPIARMWLTREGHWTVGRAEAIAVSPTLRGDGSVLSKPGLDTETGTLLLDDPGVRLPEGFADWEPGEADARAALALLESLLVEFPFAGPEDKAVALSGILTPAVRAAMAAAPLHAFNAPDAGTGKSFLVDLCCAITIGRPPPVSTIGQRDEESEKRLGALLLSGTPVGVLDNVNGRLGGDLLCQAIERPSVLIRVLGLSELRMVENRTCLMATGNNLVVVGDLVRRTIECRLDADMDRPELRQFTGNPLHDVLRDRGRYLAAALTVVRAHVLAGCPGAVGLQRLASFGDWDRLVRGALVWLGQADPVRTIDRIREADPDRADFDSLLRLWARLFGLDRRGELSARELVEHVVNGNILAVMSEARSGKVAGSESAESSVAALRDVLGRIAGGRNGGFDTQRLGTWLGRHKGKVSGNLKTRSSGRKH